MCKLDESVKLIYFPPKKPFSNLSSTFLVKRLRELQEYLNKILLKYPIPPAPLAQFIDWNLYVRELFDLIFISLFFRKFMELQICWQVIFLKMVVLPFCQNLTESLIIHFISGDMILKMGFQFEFNVLQVYAINQRLHCQSPTNCKRFTDPINH